MTILFILPDGNAMCPSLIRSVQQTKKGVACFDTQKRVVAWIPVADAQKCLRVRDIMIKAADEGRRFQQPDWSFLSDSVAAD